MTNLTKTPISAPARPQRSHWPLPVQILVCPALLLLAVYVPALIARIPAMAVLTAPQAQKLLPAVLVVIGLDLITLALALIGVALIARWDGGRRLRDLGWRWQRRSLPALLLGIVVSGIIFAGAAVSLMQAHALRPAGADLAGLPVAAALTLELSQGFVLQAIPEELIFRGYLLSSLRLPRTAAVVVSSLAFGSVHLISAGGQQGLQERIMYLAMPPASGWRRQP